MHWRQPLLSRLAVAPGFSATLDHVWLLHRVQLMEPALQQTLLLSRNSTSTATGHANQHLSLILQESAPYANYCAECQHSVSEDQASSLQLELH
jgi:hypothetical protein